MKKYGKSLEAQQKRSLWRHFSAYIKARDNYKCFTCGRIARGQAMHAGHFIPKGAGGIALYFNEDNVHAQCAGCNLFLAGNQHEYGKRLGEKMVAELYKIKQQITKNFPYEERIAYYKKKLSNLDK